MWCGDAGDVSNIIENFYYTVSVRLQPLVSIFQYGFLGEFQVKKSLKKGGLFDQKIGFYSRKKPKHRTFEKGKQIR